MKQALIIGGAAIAIYVVWKFGTAAAGPSLATGSAPIGSGSNPFPAVPPSPFIAGTSASLALQSLLARGIIASVTPIDPGPLTAATTARYKALGYQVTLGAAYAPGPNAPAPGTRISDTQTPTPSGSGVAIPAGTGLIHGLIVTGPPKVTPSNSLPYGGIFT